MAAKSTDAGLELIATYERAIVLAHLERYAGHSPEVLAQERATVAALAARIGEALRNEYRARTHQA